MKRDHVSVGASVPCLHAHTQPKFSMEYKRDISQMYTPF